MMDKENPCRNCIHSIVEFVDIDGSGRHDYPIEDCDYENGIDGCNEENGYAGWEEEES